MSVDIASILQRKIHLRLFHIALFIFGLILKKVDFLIILQLYSSFSATDIAFIIKLKPKYTFSQVMS